MQCTVVAALLCGLQSAAPANAADAEWTTTAPFTYVLDYGSRHVGREEYIRSVASAPPTLLHLGKDVPMTHNWGPIAALGGENQAYGKGHHIRRLTPNEVRDRLASLREMARKLHKAGVRWVTPYICSMTLAGHHENRTGFWEFYDHWDEYRALGLGPRPPTDPIEWMQRQADGGLVRFYGYSGDHYPPYKPNHRYAACVNNPGWRAWHDEVVKFVAKCGFDGVFVDNGGSQRCYCDHCQTGFREFIARRYTPRERRRHFGADDLAEIQIPKRSRTLPYAEAQRFWLDSLRRHQACMRAAGERELGRHFIVFPNGGRTYAIKNAFPDSDFVMFELSVGDHGTHPGMAKVPIVGSIFLRRYNDHVFEYKYVQCLRRRVKPVILTRAGWPRSLKWLRKNVNVAALGMAECGAFSGGGGFLLRPKWNRFREPSNAYRKFFESHPDLYAGMDSYAQVGVAAFADQKLYGNIRNETMVRSMCRELCEAHVMFDLVPEPRFTAEHLARYDALIVPNVTFMSRSQIDALKTYVARGGRAAIVGDTATADDRMVPFDRPPLADLDAPAEPSLAKVWGKPGVLVGPEGWQIENVKVNAFANPDQIVVHVVNYNVPLGENARPPVIVKDLALSIPLPKGRQPTRIDVYDPEEDEAHALDYRVTGGRAWIALPPLRIYKVIRIAL